MNTQLLTVDGLGASGKSTLTRFLSKELSAPIGLRIVRWIGSHF